MRASHATVLLLAICLLAALDTFVGASEMTSSTDVASRREQIVQASIIGTHAYQVILASDSDTADAKCYDAAGLSREGLEALAAHQASLLADDVVEVEKWINGAASSFDPSKDLEPLLAAPFTLDASLPVNVFASYLSSAVEANRSDVLAIASLYQTCLEVERDGNLLWDQMHFYRALGFATYVSRFGLGGSDEDFLEVGKVLAPATCASPFATGPAEWQIAARKIWNWGEKYGHVRDNFTLAREMLLEDDLRVLVPRIRALPPQRIAIIGHSFSMDSHWAAPASFASIVTAMFQLEKTPVVFRQWYGGGLTASRAIRNFYEEALAWKPDKVLFVIAIRREEDEQALRTMADGFKEIGAGVYTFDTLRDPSENARRNTFGEERAREFGLTPIEVGELLAASPVKDTFLCLDGIHMTEAYHRLMAREWLKFLVGARGAKLED